MNASDLTLIQRGQRLYSINKKYRYLKHHPPSLFSLIMREAIHALSNGASPDTVSSTAVSSFLSAAMSPGLSLPHGTDPYMLSQDFCATMRTILEYLSRQPLFSLSKHKDTTISGIPWSFLNHVDDSEVLHRWVFVDSINPDTLYHYARSWEVFADQCILDTPLTLHLIAIGRTLSNRRVSPWSRIFTSPHMPGQFKFKNKTGNHQLDPSWRPLFYADSSRNKPSTWVDLMERDEILDDLTLTKTIPAPTEIHRNHFLTVDLPTLHQATQEAMSVDPFTLPMCRTSCDTPFQCPHELVCYSSSPSLSTLESSGLYAKLPARTVK